MYAVQYQIILVGSLPHSVVLHVTRHEPITIHGVSSSRSSSVFWIRKAVVQSVDQTQALHKPDLCKTSLSEVGFLCLKISLPACLSLRKQHLLVIHTMRHKDFYTWTFFVRSVFSTISCFNRCGTSYKLSSRWSELTRVWWSPRPPTTPHTSQSTRKRKALRS